MMHILSVASEVQPLIKTGGLADVTGALPKALGGLGIAVKTLLPGYPAVLARAPGLAQLLDLGTVAGGPARLLGGEAAGLDLLVLEAPHLFDRAGGPYADPSGRDWGDNGERFAALSRIAADLAQGRLAGFAPDVVHVHDWQAGLVPAYLHYDGRPHPPTLLTIHNLAFQGRFPRDMLARIGLPPHAFAIDGVEYYGDVGFLKAGIFFADRVNTVSPTYANEVRDREGMGLAGLLRGRGGALSGILNGLDTDAWDPANDPHLPTRYDVGSLELRQENKAALQRRLGLQVDADAPLFGVVSRLSWQKGVDLLLAALPTSLEGGAQLAILGAGDVELERAVSEVAARHPGRIGCVIGYDEALSHQMQGACDALLVPSRFEPCGLTQLQALRYGCVPVVAGTGGLADTIIDANPAALAAGVATGVKFSPVTVPMLEAAIRRTIGLYRDPPTWRRLQENGMAADVSWRGPAAAYAALYRELIAGRR